jgi:succinate dehydrogenase/fumarate reductase flavoprotein subunit
MNNNSKGASHLRNTEENQQRNTSGVELEADFVVVGSGAAGLTAAITARRRGLSVIVLECQDVVGGTTARSGTWIWSPNNRWMRELGFTDERDDAIRYMARLSFPERYQADAERFGLDPHEFEMLNVFYSTSGKALEELADAGALDPVVKANAPDYFADLPEDKAPYGRVVVSRGRARPDQLTGAEWVLDLRDTALALGVDIRFNHRVSDVIQNEGRITGVVGTVDGKPFTVNSKRGVLFATGGFTHNPDLMSDHMSTPVRLGGAAKGSRGDFMRIGASLGARLHNTAAAWLAPIPLEALVRDPQSVTTNIFALRGDSMIMVNKYGRRTVNEKLPYHELGRSMLRWDASQAEHPDLRMFMIFDSSARVHFSDGTSGNPIKPPSEHDPNLVEGNTLEELSAAIKKRILEIGPTHMAGLEIAQDFASNLKETIEEFNRHAATGKDPIFHRGESAIELFRNGPARPGNENNAALFPFDSTGPYFALILAPGTLDTKGGPAIDVEGRVLRASDGEPIPGLFAAGNCAGFPSGQAYWAGGATIGLAVTFGYLAALNVSAIKQN